MEYNKYFIIIIICSSISGLFLGLLNNKIIEQEYINDNDINYNNKEKTKEEKKDEEKDDNNISKKENNKNIENKQENDLNKKIKKENKLKIAIAYATDNKYIYPTIVAMTSLVDTAGINTFYNIYIMHSQDLTAYSKNFLKTVETKYPDKCSIIFLNMENKYKGLKLNFRISTPAYYRLSLQDILPDVKRIIWMDGDTLVFEDLTELIELDMKGAVVMGFLDSEPDAIKSFGFKNATVLCSGVLLLDLEFLRKYDYSKKIEEFIKKNKGKLNQQDQTIINVVMQDRIAPLPPKYGMWAWGGKDKENAIIHNNKQRPWLKYNEEEFLYAVEHPAILHFIWPKPFWRRPTAFDTEWWDYARRTGFYDEIYKNSPIPKIKW